MKKRDRQVQLTKEEKQAGSEALKEYLMAEFELEVGGLQAEILLDFITEHIGIDYYNHGISDAYRFMMEKTEDLYLLMKEKS